MSVDFTQEEREIAISFLRDFNTQYPTPLDENLPLPLRVVPTTVRNEEFKGYLIEWTLECLSKCNCPEILAAIITYQVTKKVLDGDFSYYNKENNELDVSLAARDIMMNIQSLCSFWNQETPKLQKSKKLYPSCVHAIKNTRRKMEDKHVILPHFNNLFHLNKEYPSLAFFAVYDGHGGADAAVYSATHLHCFLANSKNLSMDPKLAIQEAFLATDDSFGLKAKAEGLRSGCTAVTALISDNKLYIGWLGDSQAVLCKDGKAVPLMEPHKPENQKERERVEALGGCVVYFGAWRVNGSLSVSRAIGDVEHKPYISNEPCITEYTLDGNEEFLVLACDGLWDSVGRDHAIELVVNHISHGNSRETVAKLLVDEAKNAGSNDNISVVIVYLDANSNLSKETNGIIDAHEQIDDLKENLTEDGSCVHIVETKSEDHDSIVPKVKIPSENTTNVASRVTSEKYDSKSCQSKEGNSILQTSHSADSSPKQTKKGKSVKSKTSSQSRKGHKTSNQLGIDAERNSRRKSAPASFSS